MKALADTFITDLEVSHPVQRDILAAFKYQNSTTYTLLLPSGMSGNAFNYHLRNLVKMQLITKLNDGYHITPRGKFVIETMSLDATRYKIRPVSMVFLHLSNEFGEVLMYNSKRQPAIGMIDLPAVKQGIATSTLSCLNKILAKQKVALQTTLPKFTYINSTCYEGDQLVFHRAGPCFYLTFKKAELADYQTSNVKSIWLKPEQHQMLQKLQSEPTFLEVEIRR